MYEIENGYYLIVDGLQYCIGQYKGKDKNGKDVINYIGFYSTPEQAVASYAELCRKKALQAHIGRLSDFIRVVKEENSRIETLLKQALNGVYSNGTES